MEYRKLGKTNIDISTVALGCWAFAGGKIWGDQEDQDSIDTVKAALDAGINFIDTAEGYGNGHSEEIVGRALTGQRDRVVIATKVSPNHLASGDVIAACERSLRRLQTDYIDLYQVHWPNHDIPFDETAEALVKLQEQGKIRSIGVSNFGFNDLSAALETVPVAANQLIYSLLWRAVEYDVQPVCTEHDVSILCYSPLAQGLLSGKYNKIDQFPASRMRTKHFSSNRPAADHHEPGCEEETFNAIAKIQNICDELNEPMGKVALAWLLHQPAVGSVLAGARHAGHVKSNAEAADLSLSDDVIQTLNEATNDVKQAIGNDLDFVNYGRIR